jgi:hypothetical protein
MNVAGGRRSPIGAVQLYVGPCSGWISWPRKSDDEGIWWLRLPLRDAGAATTPIRMVVNIQPCFNSENGSNRRTTRRAITPTFLKTIILIKRRRRNRKRKMSLITYWTRLCQNAVMSFKHWRRLDDSNSSCACLIGKRPFNTGMAYFDKCIHLES